MTGSLLTQVLLPIAIAIIMFGMGLSLTTNDFTRLLSYPKAVFTGLVGQLILLPLLAYVLVFTFQLSPELSVGLMIIAVCPGGTVSNVISQLCRANLALSVTLTVFCTLIGIFTAPWLIGLAYSHYLGQANVPFSLLEASAGLMAITLLPILLGMVVKAKSTHWADASEPYFRKGSAMFMLVMIVAILVQEREHLIASFSQLFLVCLSLNLGSVLLGLMLAKLQNLSFQDSLTLAIEVGIQNATLAILIALSFLSDPQLALPAGVYGVTMYVGAGVLFLLSQLKVNKARLQGLS